MKFLKKPFVLLLLVVVLASILRFYNLGKVPGSLNWDEVSLGYNAYSILETGKDEYGSFLPVVLRSYDDYKPALYSYFAIPFIATLGLSEFTVRAPSAVAGVSAVIIVYFLILELFGKKSVSISGRDIKTELIALLASFFLAISPWHIQFSRISFESNVGLTINLLVFLMFLKGLRKYYLLPIAFGLGALNIHMYQSERVFTPLLLLALTLIFYKKILKIKKWFAISAVTALVIALPLVLYIINDSNALMRAKGVSVFSQQSTVQRSAIKLLEDEKTGNLIGKVFDNRRVDFVKSTAYGYISHFDLNWIFVTGDIARHHAPQMGLLYLFQLPFLLIGLYLMFFLNIDRNYKIAFFAYFLLVPVPASITSGVPHAVRTLNFEWTWELFIALGLIASIVFIYKEKKFLVSLFFKFFAFGYLLIAILNFAYLLNQYFVQQNYFHAEDWLYGYKQAIVYTNSVQDKYDKIVVENEPPFDQSYMFFLFYSKVNPVYYQSLGGTISGGFREKHTGFGKYTFEPIEKSNYDGKVLYVGKKFNDGKYKIQKDIKYPNGNTAILIAEK